MCKNIYFQPWSIGRYFCLCQILITHFLLLYLLEDDLKLVKKYQSQWHSSQLSFIRRNEMFMARVLRNHEEKINLITSMAINATACTMAAQNTLRHDLSYSFFNSQFLYFFWLALFYILSMLSLMQYAKWLLNKIENTPNETFIGWQSMHQKFRT